jgi:hypothetical protein
MQRDKAPEQVWSEQTPAGGPIRFPIDQHLPTPQPGHGRLVVAAQVGGQAGIGVRQGGLDARQTGRGVH